jgi:hypothetical protein
MNKNHGLIVGIVIATPLVALAVFLSAWLALMVAPALILGALIFGLPWSVYKTVHCLRSHQHATLLLHRTILNNTLLAFLSTSSRACEVYAYFARNGKKLHLWVQFKGSPIHGNQVIWTTHVSGFNFWEVINRLRKKLALVPFDQRMESIQPFTLTARVPLRLVENYSESDQLFFQELGMPRQSQPQWLRR